MIEIYIKINCKIVLIVINIHRIYLESTVKKKNFLKRYNR